MKTEEDKFRKADGRAAAQEEKDSEFLNDEALDEDLIAKDQGEENDDDSSGIVNSKHPENQEWNAREDQNSSGT